MPSPSKRSRSTCDVSGARPDRAQGGFAAASRLNQLAHVPGRRLGVALVGPPEGPRTCPMTHPSSTYSPPSPPVSRSRLRPGPARRPPGPPLGTIVQLNFTPNMSEGIRRLVQCIREAGNDAQAPDRLPTWRQGLDRLAANGAVREKGRSGHAITRGDVENPSRSVGLRCRSRTAVRYCVADGHRRDGGQPRPVHARRGGVAGWRRRRGRHHLQYLGLRLDRGAL